MLSYAGTGQDSIKPNGEQLLGSYELNRDAGGHSVLKKMGIPIRPFTVAPTTQKDSL